MNHRKWVTKKKHSYIVTLQYHTVSIGLVRISQVCDRELSVLSVPQENPPFDYLHVVSISVFRHPYQFVSPTLQHREYPDLCSIDDKNKGT